MKVSFWPEISVSLTGGTGVIHLPMHPTYISGDEAAMRIEVMAHTSRLAHKLGRPVRMSTRDSSGDWRVAVWPDGCVTPLVDDEASHPGDNPDALTCDLPHDEACRTCGRDCPIWASYCTQCGGKNPFSTAPSAALAVEVKSTIHVSNEPGHVTRASRFTVIFIAAIAVVLVGIAALGFWLMTPSSTHAFPNTTFASCEETPRPFPVRPNVGYEV